MTSENRFIRLPARRRGFTRRASLWDAGEYLLSVHGTMYSESYRRFYYRDIKAIVLQKGGRLGSLGALISSGLVAFVFLLISVSTPHAGLPLKWFWLAPALLFVLLLGRGLIFGCRVSVYTAVSSEELPAIVQRSAAARVMPRIIDKIREAQGTLPESYQAASEAFNNVDTRTLPLAGAAASFEPIAPPPQALYGSIVYFLAMLASAGFAFWYRNTLLTPKSLMTAKVLFCALNAAGVAAGVWALLNVFRIRLLSGLRLTIFAGLGLLAARSYALYFILIALRVVSGTLEETMATIHWRQWFGTADCALSLLIAIAGLIVLTFTWQSGSSAQAATKAMAESSIEGGSISSL